MYDSSNERTNNVRRKEGRKERKNEKKKLDSEENNGRKKYKKRGVAMRGEGRKESKRATGARPLLLSRGYNKIRCPSGVRRTVAQELRERYQI